MRRHGFSLVELSIVLVIIGLIVGGIMAGSSMIRASEVKTVIAQATKYKAAMLSFRSKYAGWPGDLRDATNYWGVRDGATGDDATCFDGPTTTGTGTCNGDGDGIIYSFGNVYLNERPQAWQHLANAGLIDGQYTGYAGLIGAATFTPGVNVAPSAISNSYFAPYTKVPTTGHANYFDSSDYHVGVNFSGVSTPPLKPEEAWNVDFKIDDGRPGTGYVWTYKATGTWAPNCTTTDDPTTSEYNITNSAKLCYFSLNAE